MNEFTENLASNVAISVNSQFIAEQSSVEEQRFVFSYTITINNHNAEPVTLLARHWLITDANGHQVTVEGEGVVGQQPEIAANTSFTYTSGSILKTPVGTMQGFYEMQFDSQHTFSVEIPVFRLAQPNILN
jgi:ApaG protein